MPAERIVYKTGNNSMKTSFFLSVISACLLFAGFSAYGAEKTVPSEINGFKLGTSIEEYDFINYRNYLKEVVIDDIGGFRRGSISYGTCARPGEIVSIKLKYKKATRKYYKELLKRFKEKFGKPEEFTGDSFGIVLSWKWRFKDKDGNYISLTLQHNQKNVNETMGNMVKLSMPDRIAEERKCFLNTCATRQQTTPDAMMDTGWNNLIPR